MHRSVLALFAKAPVPGQVKTRLSPPLTPTEAAELYEAMLLDTVAQHQVRPGRGLFLWFAPAEAEGWFRAHIPPRFRLRPQRGAGLAERMRALFEEHASEGADRIVLRGTDSPTLPPERIREAFELLESADLVLCPDRDGGYNLIGLRRPAPELFDLELSTGSVLDTTLEHAQALGMSVALLEPHHDVDTQADLELLASTAKPEQAPLTCRWLAANLRKCLFDPLAADASLAEEES